MMSMYSKSKEKMAKLKRRRVRIRAKLSGTSARPRLSVYRSLKYTSAQLIDDATGVTLISVTSRGVRGDAPAWKGKTAAAYLTGKLLAEKAQQKAVTRVIFDRGGRAYHGRVAALAQGARDGGLLF